ncbi:hypothetical protein M2T79_09355 [Elizabethkingia miricola]|uniref:hypothetical protein n=1 Tax=Elizabethkingia miricola TaxID=172045 RepID=UPI002019EAAD|nr:hypothetical protein [Elizabethkingia miricola]MCL1656805.1 hypothetical protein [Elizabethkingia miricola]
MKVKNIKQLSKIDFELQLEPSLIEKLFFSKSKNLVLRDTGNEYIIGSVTVYITEDGSKLPPYNKYVKKLENWRRKF